MYYGEKYIYLKRKEVFVKLKAEFLSRVHGVNVIDKFEVDKYKKSDTIFILGSGGSVNNLKDKHWKVISENDSLGLNFWIIHDFVSSFYCYEEPRASGERKDIFYEILNKKKGLLLDKPVFIKDLLSSKISFGSIPQELKKNVYLSLDFDLPVRGDDAVMMEYLEILKKLNRFRCTGKIGYIYSITASLSYAVFFSLLMGYKKIVFCGVDLSDSSYFYEEREEYYRNKGFRVPKSMQNPGVHSTNIRGMRKIPISDVLNVLYEFVFKELNVEFYVAQNTGVLSKYYKSYF